MNEQKSNDLDFRNLPPYRPRVFVPLDADLGDAGQVTGLYQKLLDRAMGSSRELERWLLNRSELEAAARPLPELFAAAGLTFDFSEKTVAPLIDAIRLELERS